VLHSSPRVVDLFWVLLYRGDNGACVSYRDAPRAINFKFLVRTF